MTDGPEHTAERVALWRALHVRLDPPPYVLEDEIGLRLADPGEGWPRRPDMDPDGPGRYRAGIVVRSRFVEDLVAERVVSQYVILGAGLDTFAQRRPGLAARLRVFEVDQPEPQAWKRRRLTELGYGVPEHLRLVPVDFETESWWDRLLASGFDPDRPAVVASTGVSMYLTEEANAATLRRLATLAPGSLLAMTFAPPLDLLPPEDQAGVRAAAKGARAAGTPWLSFFRPEDLVALARASGFPEARHVSAADLNARYLADRTDGFRTSAGEEFLLAST